MKDTLSRTIYSETEDIQHSNGANHSVREEKAQVEPKVASEVRTEEAQFVTPRRRRWRIVLPVVLVLAVAAAVAYFVFSPAKSVVTATVTRGTIISSVETTGKLQAQTSAKLSFRTSGRVERVIAKQGDKVKKGDLLAELDTGALQRQLSQANAQLEISRLKVKQAKEGPQAADVAAAQANLNGAAAQLAQVKAGASAEALAAAQSQLDQAQAKLDALKKGPSKEALAAAQARLDQAKGNRDLVATTAANTTEQARILWVQASSATENFLDPAGKVEQARLNYEAAKKSETEQVQIAAAKVTEAEQELASMKAGPAAEDLRVAQEGVNQAKANLDKLKKGATAEELAQAQAKVDAAQAALDKVKAGPSATDLAILDQQVSLAQIAVDGAAAQVADAQVVSPIDGTLLNIDLDVGEVIGALQPVATVADTTSLRIKADIDEIDVGRVTAGQGVTVTLDSYPGVKMDGKIESLAPGATLKQGSTVYQATVAFTPATGVVPREGMAANVNITAKRKDNVLTLPNRAFEQVGKRSYVTVRQPDGSTRKVEVETGLSNTSDTEVLSGISEGQVVAIK